MYRQYENPYELETMLADARQRLEENPDDEFLCEEVADLEERVNFAWQDDEFDEGEGYESYDMV